MYSVGQNYGSERSHSSLKESEDQFSRSTPGRAIRCVMIQPVPCPHAKIIQLCTAASNSGSPPKLMFHTHYLTLAHAQEGYCSWSVSVCVCVLVSVPDFSRTANAFTTKLAMKDKTHGPDASRLAL